MHVLLGVGLGFNLRPLITLKLVLRREYILADLARAGHGRWRRWQHVRVFASFDYHLTASIICVLIKGMYYCFGVLKGILILQIGNIENLALQRRIPHIVLVVRLRIARAVAQHFV